MARVLSNRKRHCDELACRVWDPDDYTTIFISDSDETDEDLDDLPTKKQKASHYKLQKIYTYYRSMHDRKTANTNKRFL